MKEITINKLPSPTWSWLKMNSSKLESPEDFLTSEAVLPQIEDKEKFESDGVDFSKFSDVATSDFTETLSALGNNSIFEGEEPLCISLKEYKKLNSPLVLSYSLKEQSSVCSQIIRAKENSEFTVIILSTSSSTDNTFQAIRTKIVAENDSSVHLIKVNLLGRNAVQIDSTEVVEKENANVTVTHVVLGASKTYVAVGSSLKEYRAVFKSDLAYYLSGNQELDLNYLVQHFEKKSECEMHVKGTLKDESKKIYRGTIDFKNGCSGSIGEEQEEVLLLSPKVKNDSIPVILCDEEDVSGEHGATIGRLSEDVLFYMKARGISEKEAEKLVSRAKVQSVISLIKDEKTVQKIEDFMDGIFGVN